MLLRSPIHLVNEVPRSRVSGGNGARIVLGCQHNLSLGSGVSGLFGEALDAVGRQVGKPQLAQQPDALHARPGLMP